MDFKGVKMGAMYEGYKKLKAVKYIRTLKEIKSCLMVSLQKFFITQFLAE